MATKCRLYRRLFVAVDFDASVDELKSRCFVHTGVLVDGDIVAVTDYRPATFCRQCERDLKDCMSCMQEAVAEEQRMAARYVNDIDIAKSQRDFELKKAVYDQEVRTKTAQSDLAYALQVSFYVLSG